MSHEEQSVIQAEDVKHSEHKTELSGFKLLSIDYYIVDWEKVQTLDDMKRLLAALGVLFGSNTPNLESIKDLVRPLSKHQ